MSGEISSFFQEVGHALKPARLASYRPNPTPSPSDCLATYLWDVALAESLLPNIHFLEVAYRNAVHDAVARLIAPGLLPDGDWLLANTGILDPLEAERVVRAKEELQVKKLPLTEANLVDNLTLGFWTNLLNVRYEQKWPRIIKAVFPHVPRAERSRAAILPRMQGVRDLRNTIFHHHSIWHWHNLPLIHADLHAVLGWVSTPASQMARALDRFPKVHQQGWQAFVPAVNQMVVAPSFPP